MACRFIGLYVALCIITCTGFHKVEAAILTASFSPNPALKGASSPHSVQCNYSLSSGEDFQLIRILAADNQVIAEVSDANDNPQWAANSAAANSLRPRGNLSASVSLRYFTMTLRDTQCSDNNQTYLCRIQYTANNGNSLQFNVTTTVVTVEANLTDLVYLFTHGKRLRDTLCSDNNQTYQCRLQHTANKGNNVQVNDSTTVVAVEAAPLAPVMKVIPASDNATEFTNMTFECEGNVGRPAGTFQWYIFTGSGPGQEVTDQAKNLAETASGDGCTFSRKSQLIWNMTRTEENKRFVVRCRVSHPTQGNQDTNACSDANVDFCAMSPEISIQYPVSVSVARDTVTAYEGKDLTINCLTDGNPDPYRIDWQKEGENEALPSSGDALILNNVTSDDQGSYICTAYNTIEGSSRQASTTVLVTVEKTTTRSVTTTTHTTLSTTSTALKTSTSLTNADTGSSSGSDNLLGPVLGSVLGVVLAINAVVVVVVCWRRYSQGKAGQNKKSYLPDTALRLSRTQENSVHNQSPSAPVEETNYYSDIKELQHNYDSLYPYQNAEADRKLYSQLTSHPVSK